jgi:hypothetical protein
MPQPVITGFTSGIAVIIFASQFKDLLGLQVEKVPAEFIAKIAMLAQHAGEFQPWAIAIAGGSAAVILAVRRWAPSAPGFLVAVCCPPPRSRCSTCRWIPSARASAAFPRACRCRRCRTFPGNASSNCFRPH